jgi:NADPH:quinone reductase-like Zn-dependent oxidoreductase
LEAAGVVIEDSNGFSAGERVLTTRATSAKGGGGYAGKIAVHAQDLARIPDGVTFEQAVAAGLAASTAWGSLFDLGNLQAGERVLIWAGSSGVGSIAIQMAKHAGAWVATTTSSSGRGAELHKLGADLVLNYKNENIGKLLQDQGGVNLVLELVGTTLQTSLNACAPDAKIILVGNLGGQQAMVDTQSWRLKRVQVIGGGTVHTSVENEEKLLKLIADKSIAPLIADTLPVDDAAKAHHMLSNGEPQGKIVLKHT